MLISRVCTPEGQSDGVTSLIICVCAPDVQSDSVTSLIIYICTPEGQSDSVTSLIIHVCTPEGQSDGVISNPNMFTSIRHSNRRTCALFVAAAKPRACESANMLRIT